MTELLRQPWIKRLARMLGWAATIAAFAYLYLAIARLDIVELFARLTCADWTITAVASFAYAAALLLLAQAWNAMADEKGRLSFSDYVSIYGPAVIAKYLPGSIFQYASRQLSGAKYGLKQKAMARSSVFEAAFHVPMALLSAALLTAAGGIGLATAAIFCAAMLLAQPKAIVRAAALQMIFFCAMAGLVLMLAETVVGASDGARLAAMFMLAWLAGFLVPVAPGGIGIREVSLLALAVPAETAPDVAMFALLTRLVTLAGDGLFGAASYLLPSFLSKRQASS